MKRLRNPITKIESYSSNSNVLKFFFAVVSFAVFIFLGNFISLENKASSLQAEASNFNITYTDRADAQLSKQIGNTFDVLKVKTASTETIKSTYASLKGDISGFADGVEVKAIRIISTAEMKEIFEGTKIKNAIGSYDPDTDTISINAAKLYDVMYGDTSDLSQTVAHEFFHAYTNEENFDYDEYAPIQEGVVEYLAATYTGTDENSYLQEVGVVWDMVDAMEGKGVENTTEALLEILHSGNGAQKINQMIGPVSYTDESGYTKTITNVADSLAANMKNKQYRTASTMLRVVNDPQYDPDNPEYVYEDSAESTNPVDKQNNCPSNTPDSSSISTDTPSGYKQGDTIGVRIANGNSFGITSQIEITNTTGGKVVATDSNQIPASNAYTYYLENSKVAIADYSIKVKIYHGELHCLLKMITSSVSIREQEATPIDMVGDKVLIEGGQSEVKANEKYTLTITNKTGTNLNFKVLTDDIASGTMVQKAAGALARDKLEPQSISIALNTGGNHVIEVNILDSKGDTIIKTQKFNLVVLCDPKDKTCTANNTEIPGGNNAGTGVTSSSTSIASQFFHFTSLSDLIGFPSERAPEAGLRNVVTLLKNVIQLLLDLAGLLAFIMILYGSVIYLTSYGDDSKAELAKKTIVWSVIGVVVVMLSKVILLIVYNIISK